MTVSEFLAESKRIEEAATPGPWEAGDWWHIQSAEFCPCRPEWGPAHVQRMSINGQMMMAHRHRRSEPLGRDVIYTEPWKDGHPRAVVITTNEYGAIDPENAEFIARARTALPRMREALEAVLRRHCEEVRYTHPSYAEDRSWESPEEMWESIYSAPVDDAGNYLPDPDGFDADDLTEEQFAAWFAREGGTTFSVCCECAAIEVEDRYEKGYYGPDVAYPCRTVRAIESALAENGGTDV